MPSSVTVPVYYIRHGQSQWNALQTAERATGRPESEIKAIGDRAEFTDSPLSAKGVGQGRALSRQLFGPAPSPPAAPSPRSQAERPAHVPAADVPAAAHGGGSRSGAPGTG